jgi:hypothetical protein
MVPLGLIQQHRLVVPGTEGQEALDLELVDLEELGLS